MSARDIYEIDLQRYRELRDAWRVVPGRFPDRWLCIFGHSFVRLPSPPGVMGGIGGPRLCTRCGHRRPGLPYPPMPLAMRERAEIDAAKRRLAHVRAKLKAARDNNKNR